MSPPIVQNDWLDREPPVLRVSEVSAVIKETLEGAFPSLSVRGEISNLSRPRSGHLYFSLLDDSDVTSSASRLTSAQLPCVLWRSTVSRLRFRPESGTKVIVSGRIGVYEPRGSYQLIGSRIEPVGVGDLQRLFEELKNRLRAEGLFAPERKRPLPFLPEKIGLVTSPSGAAIIDFLRILYRRFPGAWVRVVPVRVQGESAAGEIAAALDSFQTDAHRVDVIVVARGGGSLEDLWAFNEEDVARAIARSEIPVVSAVGHEVDYSIADFVADVRAQTPTHASELVVPDLAELTNKLDALLRRLSLASRSVIRGAEDRWRGCAGRRVFQDPQVLIQQRFEHCDRASELLENRLYNRSRQWDDAVLSLANSLQALSPLRVLDRGYAAVTDAGGRVVIDPGSVQLGEVLNLVLARGKLKVEVKDRVIAERDETSFADHPAGSADESRGAGT